MASTGLTGHGIQYGEFAQIPYTKDSFHGPNPQLHIFTYVFNLIYRYLRTDLRIADRYARTLGSHMHSRLTAAYNLREMSADYHNLYQLIDYIYHGKPGRKASREDTISAGISSIRQVFSVDPDVPDEFVKNIFIQYLVGDFHDHLPKDRNGNPRLNEIIYANTIGCYEAVQERCLVLLSWHGPDYDTISPAPDLIE